MILLLTGCIKPNGMTMTALLNQEEREKQYVNAINFYLSNTTYPIVFTDNSGIDISYRFVDAIESGRMEYLTFRGNLDKTRGKGYGECEIIEYALNNSRIILSHSDNRIAKITGRLIVKNITNIVRFHTLLLPQKATICAINSDLSFPDTRFIIASKDLFRTFLKTKESINDSKGHYFEHAFCDTIKEDKDHSFFPFLLMPQIEGVSGSTGATYVTRSNSFAFVIKYARFAISQKCRFNKLIHNYDCS